VICGTDASAFDTGQFDFAVSAASRKALSSRPGTLPSTVSAIFVIPSPGWNVTVAEVCSSSGAFPACASACESAIEKHAACAAAISSSGLVALGESSARFGQLTACSPILPLVVWVIVPLPSIKLPRHVTSALRSVAISLPRSSLEPVNLPRDVRRPTHYPFMARGAPVAIALAAVVAGCGGGGSKYTYSFASSDTSVLSKAVYIKLISPVKIPASAFKGDTIVDHVSGPKACTITQTVKNPPAQYTELEGKRVTIEIYGDNPVVKLICSVAKKGASQLFEP
jgi:hypothetical protein